jgi:Domain of unknown function (DUF5753)
MARAVPLDEFTVSSTMRPSASSSWSTSQFFVGSSSQRACCWTSSAQWPGKPSDRMSPSGWSPLQPETAVWREHAFTIFDDRTDGGERLVHLEALTRTVNLSEGEEVAHYLAAFQRLRDVAVLGDDAVELIQDVMAELLGPDR